MPGIDLTASGLLPAGLACSWLFRWLFRGHWVCWRIPAFDCPVFDQIRWRADRVPPEFMSASRVDIPALLATMRQLGRAPRRPSSPIQLFVCQPNSLDRLVHAVEYFDSFVDARDSRTTYVIRVDDRDPEIMMLRFPSLNCVRKLSQDVAWRHPAAFQRDNFQGAFSCPPLDVIHGAVPARAVPGQLVQNGPEDGHS
jgi:hypothetical protein